VPVSQLTEQLGLPDMKRRWYIQASCATNGDGLYEGFDWMGMMILSQREGVDLRSVRHSYY